MTDRIAARKQVEDAAALLQGTIDALVAHVAVLDEVGAITAVNHAWKAFADAGGFRGANDDIGENYLGVCRNAGVTVRDAFVIARRLKQLLAGRSRQARHLYPCDTEHGMRWFQMRASCFEVGGARRIVIAHEDVTEVRHADNERRELGTQLLHTLEEERRRIARELHDLTAQHLTAVGLHLTCLQKMKDGRGIAGLVSEARELLLEAQREICTVSYLLHPPVTGPESLISAAKRFIEGFGSRTGLTAKLKHIHDPLPALSGDRGAALFRVLQEALANVHKHAGATVVEVSLRHRRDIICLDVKDDGAGIDIVDWEPGSQAHIVFGVGIPGMRARVKQYDGDLTIRRARKGTVLRAWLPVGRRPWSKLSREWRVGAARAFLCCHTLADRLRSQARSSRIISDSLLSRVQITDRCALSPGSGRHFRLRTPCSRLLLCGHGLQKSTRGTALVRCSDCTVRTTTLCFDSRFSCALSAGRHTPQSLRRTRRCV